MKPETWELIFFGVYNTCIVIYIYIYIVIHSQNIFCIQSVYSLTLLNLLFVKILLKHFRGNLEVLVFQTHSENTCSLVGSIPIGSSLVTSTVKNPANSNCTLQILRNFYITLFLSIWVDILISLSSSFFSSPLGVILQAQLVFNVTTSGVVYTPSFTLSPSSCITICLWQWLSWHSLHSIVLNWFHTHLSQSGRNIRRTSIP